MHRSKLHGRSLLALLPALLLMLAAGCEGPWGDLSRYDPFAEPDPREKLYGPTPAQQISRIRRMGDEAAGMTPQQQAQASAELRKRLLAAGDPLIREEIVKTLGNFRTREAALALRLASNDKDRDVKIAAAHAWAQRHDHEAITELTKMLGSSSDVDVRIAAVNGLATFSDQEAVRAMSVALDDDDTAVQRIAMDSLRSTTGRDYGTNVVAWRKFLAGENPPEPDQPSLVQRWLFNWPLFR